MSTFILFLIIILFLKINKVINKLEKQAKNDLSQNTPTSVFHEEKEKNKKKNQKESIFSKIKKEKTKETIIPKKNNKEKPQNSTESSNVSNSQVKKEIVNKEEKEIINNIFEVTDEKLEEIDKNLDVQNALRQKLNFESSLDKEDEDLLGQEEVNINDILNNTTKINIATNIIDNEPDMWYDDPNIMKNSKLEIPEKQFKIIKYNY